MEYDISKDLPDNPFLAFEEWYEEALKIKTPNPNSMILSTSSDNTPTARVVLLKSWDKKGFVFFTNYNSIKASQIKQSPKVSLLFFWDELARQIRIEGTVKETSREESKKYFDSRPRASRIGAWASKQSRTLENQDALDKRIERFAEMFAYDEPELPEFWGGYKVTPLSIEFWKGEEARLHQRRIYTRSNAKDSWQSHLLYP